MQQKRQQILKKYGEDRQDFIDIFNPDLQVKAAQDVERCYFGNAPTLTSINLAYGKATAQIWLVPQLTNLSEYCGAKDKLSGFQLEECAGVIATEFCFLKVSELLLFFHRFKSGRYGKMYGSVDPLIITTALREFVKERGVEIDRYERSKPTEEDPEAIDINEYEEKYGKLNPLISKIINNDENKE